MKKKRQETAMGQKSREQLQLRDGVIVYELERKAVKNLNLRVRRDGTICVSARPGVGRERIETFLRQQEAFFRRAAAQKKIQLTSGTQLYVRGEPYVLSVREGLRSAMYLDGGRILLETPAPEDNAACLAVYRDFLASLAQRLLPLRLAALYPRLEPYGIPYPALRQRRMVSRWGSCVPAKAVVTLNTYLVIMPPPCLDQVVLHELCHLVHGDHSRRFYSLLTAVMPEWRHWRRLLREYGPYCL